MVFLTFIHHIRTEVIETEFVIVSTKTLKTNLSVYFPELTDTTLVVFSFPVHRYCILRSSQKETVIDQDALSHAERQVCGYGPGRAAQPRRVRHHRVPDVQRGGVELSRGHHPGRHHGHMAGRACRGAQRGLARAPEDGTHHGQLRAHVWSHRGHLRIHGGRVRLCPGQEGYLELCYRRRCCWKHSRPSSWEVARGSRSSCCIGSVCCDC